MREKDMIIVFILEIYILVSAMEIFLVN